MRNAINSIEDFLDDFGAKKIEALCLLFRIKSPLQSGIQKFAKLQKFL
ncbi:hypothetical protein [Kamptonema formosum]|nr:hypothetical protein [Oscillatoria sp. PCC 10802]